MGLVHCNKKICLISITLHEALSDADDVRSVIWPEKQTWLLDLGKITVYRVPINVPFHFRVLI